MKGTSPHRTRYSDRPNQCIARRQRLIAQDMQLVHTIFRNKVTPLINRGPADFQRNRQGSHVPEMFDRIFSSDFHAESISMLILARQG